PVARVRRHEMKQTSGGIEVPEAPVAKQRKAKSRDGRNGHDVSAPEQSSADLSVILASLQCMQEGDFSARLPGTWTGLPGKIADTFNDIIAANERMALELKRLGQAVGKEGRIRERTRFRDPKGAWGEMETSINALVDDLLRPTTEVTRA